MKLIIKLLMTILVISSLLLVGCGGSSTSTRPSVLNSKVDYVTASMTLNEHLRNNEERLKRDITGKILEVGGVVDYTGDTDTNEKHVTYTWLNAYGKLPPCTVRAIMKNSNREKVEKIRPGDIAIIRGYAGVFYDQKKHELVVFLDECELINVFTPSENSRINNKTLTDYLIETKDLPHYK